MTGIVSLIPQFIIIGTIVQNDLNVPVLKWNATIIIITTVSRENILQILTRERKGPYLMTAIMENC